MVNSSPDTDPLARVLAFYLPQFHPIPENDEWWGKGFTEWTNVAKAKPLYAGHVQPQLPSDLGFYDLRVPEVRERQAELAREAGVEGFCYWHYWFGNGRRIIERPFEEVLASGKPHFPFCLAWANQSWTGIWHGSPGMTLMKQEYPGPEDEEAHYRWASRAFHDPRYVRVDGKPLFCVFAPHDLPSSRDFIEHWQRLARADGLPGIYFVAISNIWMWGADRYRGEILDPFDAVTLLTPHDYLETHGRMTRGRWSRRWRELNFGKRLNRFRPKSWARPTRIDYRDVVARAFDDMPREGRYLPSVLPNWDNTPRSNTRGVVYEHATPELFQQYMERAVELVADRPPQQRIVFIKAWNEWAEGNFVEPSARWGHRYLDAIRNAVFRGRTQR